jgi:hypothetical protein
MGGFGQQFGGFQPPQYGGGFGQPFGGGFQQPQYGGGFGFQQPQFGGFQNQGPGNAYARQNPYQPPPGMEVNPNYQPSNRLSQDVRPSDMQFRPIQARTGTDQPPPGYELNPEYREVPPGTIRSFGPDSIRYRPIQGSASPEPAPSSYGSTEKYKAISDSPLDLQLQDLMRRLSENPSLGFAERLGGSPQGAQPFVPDERQLGPAIQPNPGFRGNFSDYGDAMRDQGVGFGNPYGGFGAPYGGSPYMGMFGGLGSLFGGNGFQGMNQQARAQAQAQQAALQNQRQFPQGSFNPTSAEEYYRLFNANTMTQSYKNPNYDPNNPDSERYITIS